MTRDMSLTIPRPESFRASDGVSVAYRRWGAADSQPTVLQHGFASDSLQEWYDPGVITSLLEAGCSVLTIDARGHGLSDAPHGPDLYGEPRIAQDLIELVEEIHVDSINLVGYSMGAIATTFVAAHRPSLVSRLVLAGIGCGAVEVGGVDTRVVSKALLSQAFLTEDPSKIDDPGLAAWRAATDASGASHRALGAAASALHESGLPLSQITAPTMVLAGRDDPFAARPEVLASAIAGARSRIVPGDHGTARFAPEFAAALSEFVSR